jgi:thioredoxin reductase (NADPH)
MAQRDTDILIIGSGPAGIQAAIHASRRKVRVIVAGRVERSALAKAHVENLFGLSEKVDGMTLLSAGRRLAERFGAVFLDGDVIHLEKTGTGFLARLEEGTSITARALIFALGVKRKGLKVKGEDRLTGRGVSYCADCDANFFRNKVVVVVGDESAAGSAALLLKKVAHEVHLISKGLSLSQALLTELKTSGVRIHEGRSITEIVGESRVESVTLDSGESIKTDGVFIELGSKGSIELCTSIDLIPDPEGYIRVDRKMATDIPGVFACGDITGGPLQAAKAIGEGCIAGLSAAEYVKSLSSGENAG